jgi:hypothetical protein
VSSGDRAQDPVTDPAEAVLDTAQVEIQGAQDLVIDSQSLTSMRYGPVSMRSGCVAYVIPLQIVLQTCVESSNKNEVDIERWFTVRILAREVMRTLAPRELALPSTKDQSYQQQVLGRDQAQDVSWA